MMTVLRAPFTLGPWRDLWFCVVGALAGLAGFAVISAMLALALATCASIVGTVIGVPLLVAALVVARALGALHRLLIQTVGERLPPLAPLRPGSGALDPLARRLRDRDGWRAVGYAMVKLPVAVAEGYAAAVTLVGVADLAYPLVWPLKLMHPAGTRLLPLSAVVLVPGGHWAIWNWPGTLTAVLAGAGSVLAGLWLARGMTIVDARLMRSLLGPGRVSELERTRAIAVEDAAAALRRVERDLHDGAQVRLAAVAMNLGLARERAGDDALRELLEAAQTGVSGALADLRRIARGIHPPVLDSGLADALASLAATSPIPAQVRADLPNRPSASIETMAYFCTAELLANAIKHSAAQEIAIIVDSEGPDLLRVRVTDDGVGGARPSRGGGLDGLAQRAATVDGTLRLSSPRGGPTTVTVELPMRIVGTGA
jgi:signal transduction histidine kinase